MEPRATKTTDNTDHSMVSAGLMWGWKDRPDSRPFQRHTGLEVAAYCKLQVSEV